jgi:predicted DNA-binding transcriptional regulator AlpA
MMGQINIDMTANDIQLIAAEVVRQLRANVPKKIIGTTPTKKLLLTDNDVADMLGISKCTVWNYSKSGLIPKPYKFGCNTRWKLTEIMQIIDVLQLS